MTLKADRPRADRKKAARKLMDTLGASEPIPKDRKWSPSMLRARVSVDDGNAEKPVSCRAYFDRDVGPID
ncbi:hypothetical protein ACVILL_002233 [Bradyrhizobium sp. USDA 3364]